MLVASILKQKLIDAVKGAKTADDSHNKIAETLQSYIRENIELNAAYIGIDISKPPLTPPDSANGSYVWKTKTTTIVGSVLKAAASTGVVQNWVLSIQNQILATTLFTASDTENKVVIPTPILMAGLVLNINMENVKGIEDTMERLANGVVSGIQSAIPAPPAPLSVTQTPGTGTTTGTSFK